MFSYSFPPIKGVGTIRNFNIAHQIAKHYELKIFSTSNRYRLPVEDVNIKRFDVEYLMTFDYKRLKSKRKVNHVSHQGKNKEVTQLNFGILSKFMNSFPFNLIFGEGGLLYILHGLIKVIFGKNNKEIILYSSFRPLADHYISYILKSLSSRRYWIADFRDLPYNPDKDTLLWPSFQKKMLKKILAKADIVTTVSEGLKEHFDLYNDNVVVLRNGMSNLFSDSSDENPIKKGGESTKFSLLYAGSLYNGQRDPSIIFEAISNLVASNQMLLDDVLLTYAGKEGSLWAELAKKFNLDSIVDNRGFVSIQESTYLQRSSQINILLSWATPQQKGILTGKFYEYMNAKRPIILVIKGIKDEEFEHIMEKLDAGIVVYDKNELDQLQSYILDKYQEWKKYGNAKSSIKKEVLNQYTWDSQFEVFSKSYLNV